MPVHKISFLFELQKQGFSESWYVNATDPVNAVAYTNALLAGYMLLKPAGTTLQAVRATDVTTPRKTYLRVLNLLKAGLGFGNKFNSDIPQAGLLLNLRGVGGHRKNWIMRCVGDDLITYDSNGLAVLTLPALVASISSWVTAIQRMGLMFQFLKPADPGNPDRLISSLAQVLNDPTQTLINYLAGPPTTIPSIPPGAQKVIVHGISRNILPGLQGPLPVVSLGATQLQAPVVWRLPTGSISGGRASLRLVTYDYDPVDTLQLIDFRSKKVGAPFIRARGRRTAMRARSH